MSFPLQEQEYSWSLFIWGLHSLFKMKGRNKIQNQCYRYNGDSWNTPAIHSWCRRAHLRTSLLRQSHLGRHVVINTLCKVLAEPVQWPPSLVLSLPGRNWRGWQREAVPSVGCWSWSTGVGCHAPIPGAEGTKGIQGSPELPWAEEQVLFCCKHLSSWPKWKLCTESLRLRV